jgi:type IV pilus assembly protein PilC
MPETLGPLNLILLLIPGIALRFALRILYGPRSRVASDLLRTALSIAATLMIVIGLLGMLIALAGPAIIPLAILGIVAALMVHDRLRRAEHRALLWSLAVAAQKGIPLGEAARAYADETLGDTGSRSLRLAESVEAGHPLSDAVRRARLRMAPAMRLAVGLGQRLGMLGPAMKQQLDDSQQADAALRDVIGRFVYLGMLIVAFVNILLFMMIKIVPVYERMFFEFELELPATTKLVIHWSNFAVNHWFIIPLMVAIPLAILFLTMVVLYFIENLHTDFTDRPIEWFLTRPRRIAGAVGVVLFILFFAPLCLLPIMSLMIVLPLLLVVLYFIGLFPRDLPVVWRLFRRYDGALVMRGLALAVRRGLPLVEALNAVGLSYPLRRIAALIGRVTQQIRGGESWTESLRRAKLISRADAAVLEAAQRTGNLPWALEEMADSVIRRQTYRIQLAMNLLFPPALLLIGSAVFLFAAGLFMPIIALIQGLT